jgi:imidazolonepropionase-like amidohydrolase
LFIIALVYIILFHSSTFISSALSQSNPQEFVRRSQILSKCAYIHAKPGPPPDFHTRTQSDRLADSEDTTPVLVRNATIWTAANDGHEIFTGDLLMHRGLIKAIGDIPLSLIRQVELKNGKLEVIEAHGAWVTPGIVDLHSHIGVGSAPELKGASDTNSRKAPILPWLRSIDGLNTHDASYELAIAGGVTTAQVLPGSANDIGGQAFIIKLRPTAERSPSSMLLEPPHSLNGSHFDHSLTPRWRHMKHACGENPSRVYGMTRLDSGWNFRAAYDSARKLRDAQDDFCAKVESDSWDELAGKTFPEDLQWESLVDVLRGRVKLSVHCYEAVDLDGIVRLTNEFEFPVASFHHAGETYLVPELLKKTWGGTPAIALFASNFRKKREAYRGSEFAPRVLAEHGIDVVMKSDHPVVNSRYLLHEAAQVHHYGLDPALALLSITHTPATAMGMGHRIGMLKPGYDADIVIWSSHPLSLASTPTQVYIDGIPQLSLPSRYISKGSTSPPRTPNFDSEKVAAVTHEGVPPLEPRSVERVLFANVSGLYVRGEGSSGVMRISEQAGLVGAEDGRVVCVGECLNFAAGAIDIVDLEGGTITPGLTSFGTPLGLVEIRLEPSTNDGRVYDPLDGDLPTILGDTVMRAQDGLMFGGQNLLLAYRSGITTAIVAPSGTFLQGVSTAFSPGAAHARVENASVVDEVALHVGVSMSSRVGVSTQVAALRNMLFAESGDEVLKSVRKGQTTLVIDVESADIMATLLQLKDEYEANSGRELRMTFAGATEAHILAHEIARAGVSVIVTQSKPYPSTWEQRRILAGPPITQESLVTVLLKAGVNVAIGVIDEAYARNTRFEAGWLLLTSNGFIDRTMALALVTTNLEKALGVQREMPQDLVAYRGGDVFEFEAKAVGVISETFRRTDLFE